MECCATEGRSSYTLIWKALQVILFKKKNKRGLWNNSGALGLGGDLLAKLLARHSSDLLPWSQGSGGLQEWGKQILKELDEYCRKFKWDPDSTQKRIVLHCIQRALIWSQELGDKKIQIVSQVVELVDNRTSQMDSHVELFEAHQEISDTTGHSGKASQDKSKNKTVAQAEKPSNEVSLTA